MQLAGNVDRGGTAAAAGGAAPGAGIRPWSGLDFFSCADADGAALSVPRSWTPLGGRPAPRRPGPAVTASAERFFDPAFYLARNLNVAEAGVGPLEHYAAHGWREGRDPSPWFSNGKYLDAYPDVREAGMDPLLHYLTVGAGQGRVAFPV